MRVQFVSDCLCGIAFTFKLSIRITRIFLLEKPIPSFLGGFTVRSVSLLYNVLYKCFNVILVGNIFLCFQKTLFVKESYLKKFRREETECFYINKREIRN